MTIRTDINVDWSVNPRIITVAAPSTEITCQDLHDTLRHMEALQSNIQHDSIVTSSGLEQLLGGELVGLTVTLLDALLQFEGRSGPNLVSCTVSGGNILSRNNNQFVNPMSPTAFVQPIIGASTAASVIEVATGATNPQDIANAVWQQILEQGLSAEEIVKVLLAAMVGTTAGVGTRNEQYKSQDGNTDRIHATFDGAGNRTNVTVDGS